MSEALLFLNGLGDGKFNNREIRAFATLIQSGYQPFHGHIDWRRESYDNLFERLAKQSQELVQSVGSLTIVGASAGGSMALNLFAELKADPNVRAVNVAGRLRRGNVGDRSYRTLERSAHLGSARASQSWYESVQICEDLTLPSLTDKDKKRLTVIKPLTDLVVPLDTMGVEGAGTDIMPVLGHHWAGSSWPKYVLLKKTPVEPKK